MKLIAGLGNPGISYQETRHNVGWRALDLLVNHYQAGSFHEQKVFQGLLAEGRIGSEKILFLKPLTFMNASGESLIAVKQFYKFDLNDILIFQDEMDFAPGTLALLAEGGAAGHNGIQSIQDRLGTKQLHRVRIGIGHPIPPQAKEDYVLGRCSDEEEDLMKTAFGHIPRMVEDWVMQGIDKTPKTWNGV